MRKPFRGGWGRRTARDRSKTSDDGVEQSPSRTMRSRSSAAPVLSLSARRRTRHYTNIYFPFSSSGLRLQKIPRVDIVPTVSAVRLDPARQVCERIRGQVKGIVQGMDLDEARTIFSTE